LSLNQILLIGNVGQDPEMRYTPSGAAVTNFSLAVNYRRSSRGGDVQDVQEETEWFRVSAWNRLAETVNQYLVKGSKVFVDGRFQSRQYVGSDGQTRTSNEVIANRVLFLDRPGQSSGGGQDDNYRGRSARVSSPPAEEDPDGVEDLPW
jgi:single-strand DNA-binding protein